MHIFILFLGGVTNLFIRRHLKFVYFCVYIFRRFEGFFNRKAQMSYFFDVNFFSRCLSLYIKRHPFLTQYCRNVAFPFEVFFWHVFRVDHTRSLFNISRLIICSNRSMRNRLTVIFRRRIVNYRGRDLSIT